MATDGTSRVGWAVRLSFVAALLAPLLASWYRADFLPVLDTAALIRLVGLGVALAVLGLLVLQKRRSRGQRQNESRTVEDETGAVRRGDERP